MTVAAPSRIVANGDESRIPVPISPPCPVAMRSRRRTPLRDPIAGTPAHYPGGAIGTSRPTAITPHCRAPWSYPIAIQSRCGRARCSPVGAPDSRRRAFARGGSPPRCAAWHPAPLPHPRRFGAVMPRHRPPGLPAAPSTAGPPGRTRRLRITQHNGNKHPNGTAAWMLAFLD